jgi:hypothetical protein
MTLEVKLLVKTDFFIEVDLDLRSTVGGLSNPNEEESAHDVEWLALRQPPVIY